YLQDEGGTENDHVFRLNPDTKDVTDLTPIKGVKAQVAGISHRKPNEILVGLNDRDPQLHDVYRIDLATAQRTLVYKNTQMVNTLADDDLNVRGGLAFGMDFKARLYRIASDGKADLFLTIPPEDLLG